MKIIQQLIVEKLLNEEILSKNLERENSFGEHICAYLLSLAYLERADSLLRKKISLWRKFVSSKDKSKYYEKLLKYKQKEDEIIVLALNEIDKRTEEDQTLFGTLYKPFSVAILSYELVNA